MGRWIPIAACVLALPGLVLAAEETKFAGTWEATAGGKVFLILKLKPGTKISGTMNAGSIHLGDDGELLEAGQVEDKEAPIFFARAEGDKLEFDFQDADDVVMHFELKLTANDKAELRIVDEHFPKLKPFPLKKIS